MIPSNSNKVTPLKKKSGGTLISNPRNSGATEVKVDASSFYTEDLLEPLHNESPKGSYKEGRDMSEYVSRRELESMMELINANRLNDNKLNEERTLRLNDKIESGNQLLSQKIDSSNALLVTQLDSVSNEIESMTSKLSLTFEKELETRFAQERQASAAEAKATRMWLWALAIPSIIGIIQIVQAYNN